MDGQGKLGGIGDLAGTLVSLRIGGTFATLAALLALPFNKRTTGMLAVVLEDCSQYVFDADGADGQTPDDSVGKWRPVRNMAALYGRSFSMLAAALADPDGFKTAIATAASIQTYTTTALNGASVASNIGIPPKTGIAFWPTVTSDSSTAAYVPASTVQFVGTYNGATVTRTATLAEANGNETQFANGPLETLVTIIVAAQVDTSGEFTFGFSGISPVRLAGEAVVYKKWLVKAYTDAANADTGTVVVGYADGTTDTVELAKGAQLEAAPIRIYATGTAPITVYE